MHDCDAMTTTPTEMQRLFGRYQSQVNLQRAVRTLRAIRERYEAGRNVDAAYVRPYSVQVAMGYADMFWIAAAIEALEKSIAGSATEAAIAAAQARAET